MSFSAAMPFSRASACMASRISRDMGYSLDEVGSGDGVVRDRDDAGVGGDRDLRLGGSDELTGEGPVPLARLAGADPRAAAEEPAEVVGLRQRPLAARRGDLERVVLADLRQERG